MVLVKEGLRKVNTFSFSFKVVLPVYNNHGKECTSDNPVEAATCKRGAYWCGSVNFKLAVVIC